MARLRGTGLGAGMALGTAAVLQMRNGVALAPEIPARLAALVAQRRLTEIPDVILIALDYRTAQAIAPSLSWARVVGFAIEQEDSEAPVGALPAVMGIPELMRTVTDDVLVLVDATRGTVLVDPDPVYLAQYTAEHDRIAPKNRLYLDEAHLLSTTLDGRAIVIVADAASQELEKVLASGADALHCPLPLTFDPADLRRQLAPLIESAGGKPLIFPYNASVPLTPLIEYSARSDITLAVSPADENSSYAAPEDVARLLEEIALLQAECAEHDIMCGTPRIAADLMFRPEADGPPDEEIAERVESLTAQGVTRLIFYSPAVEASSMERLMLLCASASANLVPVTFYVTESTLPLATPGTEFAESFTRSLALLIGAGVSGFLVDTSHVQLAKQAVREVSASECEEELRHWIADRQNT